MIETKDISVVIQGPITKYTKDCILSVKKHLPDSEIILSTWVGSVFDGIDTKDCIIVENLDPNENGETYFANKEKNIPNNTNRQIFSSLAGIQRATRKYVLRMRSDIKLESIQFLDFWDKFIVRDSRYSLFEHKILIPSFVSMNPGRNKKTKYFQTQISDWMQFGTRKDMCELYNIPLLSKSDMFFYSENDFKMPDEFIDGDAHCIWRWGSEQYLFIANVFKKLNIDYPHRKAVSVKILNELNLFFVNNFIPLDWNDWQFDSFKYPVADVLRGWEDHFDWWQMLYRYNLYQHDYRRYCDKHYKIKLNDFNKLFIKSILSSPYLKKHKIKKIKLIFKILSESIKIRCKK